MSHPPSTSVGSILLAGPSRHVAAAPRPNRRPQLLSASLLAVLAALLVIGHQLNATHDRRVDEVMTAATEIVSATEVDTLVAEVIAADRAGQVPVSSSFAVRLADSSVFIPAEISRAGDAVVFKFAVSTTLKTSCVVAGVRSDGYFVEVVDARCDSGEVGDGMFGWLAG